MTLIVIIFISRWERWGTRVLRLLPEVRDATYRVSQELYVGAVCFRDKTMAKTEATEASVVMVSASSWNVSSRVVSSCSLYLKLPVKNIRSYHKCCCKFSLLFIALVISSVITVKGMDILTHSSIWIYRIIYHSSDWHRPHPAGSGWPQIHSKSPASAFQVLRSHVWAILLRNSLRSLESYLPSVKDINGWDSVQFVECFLACTKPWICSPGVCELGVVVHFCNPNNVNAGCRGKRIRNLKSFSTTCWVWE